MLSSIAFWWVVLLGSAILDPRKFRTGVYLLLAITSTALSLFAFVQGQFDSLDDLVGAWMLLAAGVLMLGAILAFAGFLIASGVTLLRREGRSLSHWLGVGLGVALVLGVALGVAAVLLQSAVLVVLILLLALPAGYLGSGFVAFLLYGAVYPALAARVGPPPAAVIVLGSGLIRGQVPPLLAARLDRGRVFYDRAISTGSASRMLTSGGQGPDEPMPEASAMADYLVAKGVPDDHVLTETASRNTEENLSYSSAVLREAGITGPVAVVSNNFHALRAAILMRKAGLPGYAVGAPTAPYYWSAAVIREYIAILRDHLWLNAVVVVLLSVPAVIVQGSLLVSWVTSWAG